MKRFTQHNLSIENFEFEILEELSIKKELNNHSVVYIKGVIDSDEKGKYEEYLSSEYPKLNLKCGKGEKNIFKGVIYNQKILQTDFNECVLEIWGISYSKTLEETFNNRIYQNKGTMYTDVFEKIKEKNEIFDIQFSNSELESTKLVSGDYPLVLQYKESEWDFIKRISSYLNQPIVVDDTKDDTEIINIKVGIHELEAKSLNNNSGSMQRKIGRNYIHNYYTVKKHKHSRSKDIYEVGYPVKYISDQMTDTEEEVIVFKNEIYLEDNILMSDFTLVKKEEIEIKKIKRQKSIKGRSFRGEVKKLKADHTAQVEFLDLENEYKKSKSFWFPIDKPYTGAYFSPEEGDVVDIYIKGDNEKYSTLKSSSTDNDTKDDNNPKEKRIISNTKQEIVLNDEEESIKIISLTDASQMEMNEDLIEIMNAGTNLKLTKEGEVTLASEDRKINITDDGIVVESDGNTIEMSKDGVAVSGSSGETIEMSKGTVEVAAGGKSATIGNGMIDLA
ncbi:MAG: hypothetical protein ACQERZ_08195 [Fusobacteriota bacterium]